MYRFFSASFLVRKEEEGRRKIAISKRAIQCFVVVLAVIVSAIGIAIAIAIAIAIVSVIVDVIFVVIIVVIVVVIVVIVVQKKESVMFRPWAR